LRDIEDKIDKGIYILRKTYLISLKWLQVGLEMLFLNKMVAETKKEVTA
jgi:hypothetical protein